MSEEAKAHPVSAQATSEARVDTFFPHVEAPARSRPEALCLNLFGLQGRFTRESYWLVYGGCMLAAVVSPIFGAIVFWPLVIALTWISAAAVIKRFHDRDKHGAWWLVSLIPFVGTIWILVECGMLPGDEKPNQYGAKALAPADLLK